MRILLVTFYFPPFRTMGAVRTGRIARHLLDSGHDVRVLAAGRQPLQRSLVLDIAQERVTFTPWLGSRLMRRIAEIDATDGGQNEWKPSVQLTTRALKRLLKLLRRHILYLPDDQVGWFPFAVAAAKRLLSDDPVDLIYASAMPVTSLLVAARVARANGVPWVGELRDLWSENHYRELRPWQRRLDGRLERHVLGSASGLITVSEPWAEALGVFGKPVAVVSNGFDRYVRGEGAISDPERLTIVYTGGLYGGRRDPTPLLHAIRSLGPKAAAIDVSFYGKGSSLVTELARSAGVEDRVRTYGEVPYEESLSAQTCADVLLLLLWDQAGEEGVMPGKLFEYMGSGRPILAVGTSRGVAVDLIGSRSLGFVSSDPACIAGQLERWLEEKKRVGRLAPIPLGAIRDYDRRAQMQRLATFLEAVAGEATVSE